MKIAFVHYHLKPGGVTTVLKQQVEAVRKIGSAVIITGEQPEESFPAETIVIPGIAYDSSKTAQYDTETIVQSIINAVHSKWKGGCDLFHIHNPTLAKNQNFLQILKSLQKNQKKLFLQIHDFAEDGRPALYYYEQYLMDCHYGVINSRDYDFLIKSGIDKKGLHLIENTLPSTILSTDSRNVSDYVLYPVRVIRRKNIGEAILVSQFFINNEKLVVTLPPNSHADKASYSNWKDFVASNELNVEFEAGLTWDYHKLVGSSRFLITTSIMEGFGFSFLEPWIRGKTLWGRRISNVCRDFETKDVQLDHLYEKLLVPIDWVGKDVFFKRWKTCVLNVCRQMDYHIEEKQVLSAFEAITSNDVIDFGLLNEYFQANIISLILTNGDDKQKLVEMNTFLTNPGNIKEEEQLIAANAKVIAENYNQAKYQETLRNIYSKVVNEPVSQKINKKRLLAEFINLEEFSLLKWEHYDQ